MPSVASCIAEYRATEGAWSDSEDNLDCTHVCDAAEEQCADECGDELCFESCMADHPLLSDDIDVCFFD